MLRHACDRAFAAVGLVLALVASPVCAQLANSKHNLTSGGPGVTPSGDAEEICVFCHTPIGADASAAVPQWNRALPSPAMYRTYDTLGTSTLTGRLAPVGSVSLACLSCHDGAQAMSAVINTSSSGRAEDTWAGTRSASGASVTSYSNLGTDLRDDHPIGVQYGGGGITEAAPGAMTNNPDFRRPQSAVLNEVRVWWIETEAGASATRRKTDLSLYTRTRTDGYTGQTVAEPFVECASCHDPHIDKALFLRVSNARSALCLACHAI
ncbi:MAG TPA: cytochrome c3 family protein [Ramlibacter sp.]|uniref:cytochrome c3 family protein n=1 Tax=Ramlibacter sp. TaxID=1917967 RepID=UPI002D7F9DCC|nr:cytochrome c3 family protein [Ramlibacter sp.]HET8747981.1 cytochrome c3 family protein [Ramlibacter sp.]